MEKCDRSYPEETVQEVLLPQDSAVCQVQEVDLDGLRSDRQSQKSGDAAQCEASKHGITRETQKMIQQEKKVPARKIPTQDLFQKSQETESSRQECEELAEEKKSGQKTDVNVMVQQKGEISKQDSNHSETDAIHKEHGKFAEDKLLESDGNTTVQRKAKTAESILLVPDQESIQLSEQEDNDVTNQGCDRSVENELLQPKLDTNLMEQLKEGSLALMEDSTQTAEQDANNVIQLECDRTENDDVANQGCDRSVENESLQLKLDTNLTEQLKEEGSLALIEDSTQTAEQDANDVVQLECGRTTENDAHFHESESGPISLPRRIRRPRQHAMQYPSLPPLLEEPEPPLEPFEMEIQVRRNRRMLGVRLRTVSTGIRDYMIRVRERHIPPEWQSLFEELQTRCVKLFCSLLMGGILVVALYFLIDFLERKYGDSNVTSPSIDFSANLNIPERTFCD